MLKKMQKNTKKSPNLPLYHTYGKKSMENRYRCIKPGTETSENSEKAGFTIIEVMLVLGLTGLLLVGLLGGTFSAIKAQRYNDSVRSFAEYLRTIYSEVISPESIGRDDASKFGDQSKAILGKVLVFGENYDPNADMTHSVYSATLIGNASLDAFLNGSGDGFLDELGIVNAELICGDNAAGRNEPTTVSSYLPLWSAEIRQINDAPAGLSVNNLFKGTIIIARSPASGAVHTVYTEKPYDLVNRCTPDNRHASEELTKDIKDSPNDFKFQEIGFCIKSDDSAVIREVRLSRDGRNTSAVNIINADDGDNRCR